jgi:hypothetical protein
MSYYNQTIRHIYKIQALAKKDKRWQDFSGIVNSKKPISVRFFTKHVKENFEKMDYSLRLYCRVLTTFKPIYKCIKPKYLKHKTTYTKLRDRVEK